MPIAALCMLGCAVDEPDLGSTGVDLDAFRAFRARTPRSVIDGAYVVEGDVRIGDEDRLYQYWLQSQPQSALSVRVAPFGGDDVWNSSQKLNLTYCVSSNFGAAQSMVIDALEQDSRQWEARANVNFVHIAGQDGSGCTNANNAVVFNVTKVQSPCQHTSGGPTFSMSSFRPSETRPNRILEICDTALALPQGEFMGQLGHELGHSLGAPHEHLRPEANASGLPSCDGTWGGRALTPYDSKSIMHYPWCNGGADHFWWTANDRIGMASLYGTGAPRKSDILWRHSTGSVAVWLMNNSTATMGGPIGVGPGWEISGNGDFDGDGKSDILWRANDGTVAIWFMNGTVKAGEAYPGQEAVWWQILGAGDFDGDGKSDILWRDSGGHVQIWFMNGGVERFAIDVGVMTNRALEGIGDFNRDGMADLLWGPATSNPTAGDRRVWLMNAGAILLDTSPGAASAGWSVQGTGDFNGDNSADILWRHTDGSVAIWFLTDGDHEPGTPPVLVRLPDGWPPAVSNDWKIRGTGDFDGDWKSDILWRNDDGTVALWFMDGATRVAQGYPGSADNNWVIRGTGYFN